MSDEKRIKDFEAAVELLNDDWFAVDSPSQGTRKMQASMFQENLQSQITDNRDDIDLHSGQIATLQLGVGNLGNDVDALETKVGDATLQTTSPDLSGAVNELDSKLNNVGTSYTLDSKGVTTIPSGTDTVIYGKVLPQGKYLFSAKIYCNVNNASCYLMCGGLRQQLTCANIAYMQLCGLITSNGSSETQLHFYQNSGSTQTRAYSFDEVYLVRIQ